MHDEMCSENKRIRDLNKAQSEWISLDGNTNYEEEFVPDVRKLWEETEEKYSDGIDEAEELVGEMRALSGITTSPINNNIDYYSMTKHDLIKIINKQNKLLNKQKGMITRLMSDNIDTILTGE